MKIDLNKCAGCGICIPYCPMGAIIKDKDKVYVDYDECVECNICWNSKACPKDALIPDDLTDELRAFRNSFSDPLKTHKLTNNPGRGTEEMKTNDVTGRFKPGYTGVAIELGRPGMGTRFYDVEKVAKAFVEFGVQFEPKNPVTAVMKDTATGEIEEKYINEKTLSAIVEFIIPIDKLEKVLKRIKEVAEGIETVFSLDLISKVNEEGEIPTLKIAEKAGFKAYKNGKVNVGLGRPRFNFNKAKEEQIR